jgi:hypothetical protein
MFAVSMPRTLRSDLLRNVIPTSSLGHGGQFRPGDVCSPRREKNFKGGTFRAVRISAALLASAVLAASLGVSAPAHADGVHWDLSLGAGVNKRFLIDKAADDAGFGPAASLEGHIALFPLLRVGAYVTGELSPQGGVPMREMLAAGARVKITPPWPRGNARIYATLGVGYVGVYAPSYHLSLQTTGGTRVDGTIDGSGGGYLEIPVTFGVLYKVRKPIFLFAELWSRFGMGFSGSYYGGGSGGRSIVTPGFEGQVVAPAGKDLFTIGLAVGFGFDL